PSAQEQEELQRLVSTANDHMVSYQKDMQLLMTTMGRLKAAQAHVTEYILHQRAIFAPIRRVPDDILMRIFEESAGPVTRYGTFAWTLTAVCKRWRAVGFACASLW
ncbi:hypothetical protein M422DRAFT_106485, partial [Sphaerobolus stellatus SS14]